MLLVLIAIVLAMETKSLLLGESATAEHVEAIGKAITRDGAKLIHLKTLHLGPEEILVAAKVSVAENSTGEQIAAAIDDIEVRIRAAVDLKCVIYIEPDVFSQAQAGNPSESVEK